MSNFNFKEHDNKEPDIKKTRVITPPLNDNQYINDRIDELEQIIEDRDSMVENLYKEILELRDRIELIETQHLELQTKYKNLES
jgi:hypothetical protein